MHGQWCFKAKYNKGNDKAQRLSGQATTALGNVIINMLVHTDFYYKNYDAIVKAIFLGDDNLTFFSDIPDTKKLKHNIKVKYNMLSK